MTDADLRALFEAWLGQPSSAHRTCDVIGAMVRHHGQAMLALPTYPPQIRAQSPAEAPPAAEEGSGGVQEPEDRRGHATGAPGDFRCRCIDWSDADGCCKKPAPAIGNPACVSPDAEGERQPPAAITHADGSPLLRPGEDFAALHAARLGQAQADFSGPIVPRRTVHLDGRGDAAPRNPAHDEGDLA